MKSRQAIQDNCESLSQRHATPSIFLIWAINVLIFLAAFFHIVIHSDHSPIDPVNSPVNSPIHRLTWSPIDSVNLTDDQLLKTWAGLFPDSIVELKSRFVLEATSINAIIFLFSGVANVGKFLPNSYDDIKSFQGPLLSTHKQIQIIVFLD